MTRDGRHVNFSLLVQLLLMSLPQNEDIDPVPVAARIWGIGSFASYWVSDMLAVCSFRTLSFVAHHVVLQPPLWSTISTAMSIGFTAREVIPSKRLCVSLDGPCLKPLLQ